MKLRIEITCDNAAFADFPEVECGRILQEFVRSHRFVGLFDDDGTEPLLDLNGNRVGIAEFND
tara:strand:+ start:470 stop:658 length:189 start_codon:yes stop_codon:yes gene_type:complete